MQKDLKGEEKEEDQQRTLETEEQWGAGTAHPEFVYTL